MEEEIKEPESEYTLDLTTLSAGKITDLRQEGDFLVGTTDGGTRFKQHIPGKILDRKNGKFTLRDIKLS
jgi:hypothetical protein